MGNSSVETMGFTFAVVSCLFIFAQMGITSGTYTFTPHMSCYNFKYSVGQFRSLGAAKQTCSEESRCQGAFDEECRATDRSTREKKISLCYANKIYESSGGEHPSCVYQKSGRTGSKAYIRTSGLECYNNMYNRYRDEHEAIVACDRDSNCQAIFDPECNGKFRLCPVGVYYGSSSRGCVLQKADKRKFLKTERLSCYKYGSSTSNLVVAQRDCDSDSNCSGVEDQGRNQNQFTKCSKGQAYTLYSQSCVYKKASL